MVCLKCSAPVQALRPGETDCNNHRKDNRPTDFNLLSQISVYLFRCRAASIRIRTLLAFCIRFMGPSGFLVGFIFGRRRGGNFRATALARAGSRYVTRARLSCSGAAGLPAPSVTACLGDCQYAAKQQRTS